jgi:hypothetical protein
LSTAYRTSVLLALVVVLLFCSVGSVQAIGLVTIPATHQQATLNVVNNRPNLTSLVLGAWPDFYVHGCYGGMAWPGSIDVTVHLSDRAYTAHLAHEWCHEVQRACDEPGGYGSLTTAWRAFMAASWPQVDTSQWTGFTWNHTLMEAVRQAWWYPYYSGGPEYRVYATRVQMTAVFQSIGVTP